MTRDQRGFTMPLVLGVLLVATLLGAAALAAARGGTATSGESRDNKQAYAAAEAGINWYLSRLAFDNTFWAKCATVAAPQAPVNDPWNGTGTDPRRWRTIQGTGSGTPAAEYTVELLPANGAAKCNPDSPETTFIDDGSGTFRIRSTGRFNGNKRSVIATFRRAQFLDYLYLTTFETTDPDNYANSSDRTWAQANCAKPRASRSGYCSEIQFAPGDSINGPLHSDDSLLTCGSPRFGRSGVDRIETAAAAPGYYGVGGCNGTPDFRSPFQTGADVIPMPTGNNQLESEASARGLRNAGITTITLKTNTYDIVTRTGASTTTQRTGVAWPSNGLIYIAPATAGCVPSTLPTSTNYSDSWCAPIVYVNGTYGKDITIASAGDVIVNGSIQKASGTDAVAGLIADRFVRVYHPTSARPDTNGNCSASNSAGSLTDPTIEAAILAVDHSFTVDNYRCGPTLGTLNVKGAIAQRFRGAVGTGAGTSTSTGYLKNYNYDDRLIYRNPPFYLTPDFSTWRVVRSNEQAPAR